MRHENALGPIVVREDCFDLTEHDIFSQGGMGDAERDRHDFQGYDADLRVCLDDVLHEACIGIEANANTVDKEDWQFCHRGVGAVPVGEVLGWRVFDWEESVDSEGEKVEEFGDGVTMEVVPLVPEAERSD